MAVHGNTGWGFKFFSVDGGEHSDVVVSATGGGDEPMVFIDHFDKMPNGEGDCLNSLEFFLGSDLLSFQFDLIVFDVLFLDVQELELFVELLKFRVEVLLFGFEGLINFRLFKPWFSFHHF